MSCSASQGPPKSRVPSTRTLETSTSSHRGWTEAGTSNIRAIAVC